MNVPAPRPRAPQGRLDGSLWLGFGIGWAVIVGGYTVLFAMFEGLNQSLGHIPNAVMPLLISLPWIAHVALMVWLAIRGKPRTALGILAAIGSMLGLALLLIAACFGLFALSGMH